MEKNKIIRFFLLVVCIIFILLISEKISAYTIDKINLSIDDLLEREYIFPEIDTKPKIPRSVSTYLIPIPSVPQPGNYSFSLSAGRVNLIENIQYSSVSLSLSTAYDIIVPVSVGLTVPYNKLVNSGETNTGFGNLILNFSTMIIETIDHKYGVVLFFQFPTEYSGFMIGDSRKTNAGILLNHSTKIGKYALGNMVAISSFTNEDGQNTAFQLGSGFAFPFNTKTNLSFESIISTQDSAYSDYTFSLYSTIDYSLNQKYSIGGYIGKVIPKSSKNFTAFGISLSMELN